MMLNRGLGLAFVCAIGLGSMAGAVQPAPTVQLNAPRRAKKGLFGGNYMPISTMTYGYKGAGISMAQQKRAARKARNVKRNRAH
jgi:hypothetical protein